MEDYAQNQVQAPSHTAHAMKRSLITFFALIHLLCLSIIVFYTKWENMATADFNPIKMVFAFGSLLALFVGLGITLIYYRGISLTSVMFIIFITSVGIEFALGSHVLFNLAFSGSLDPLVISFDVLFTLIFAGFGSVVAFIPFLGQLNIMQVSIGVLLLGAEQGAISAIANNILDVQPGAAALSWPVFAGVAGLVMSAVYQRQTGKFEVCHKGDYSQMVLSYIGLFFLAAGLPLAAGAFGGPDLPMVNAPVGGKAMASLAEEPGLARLFPNTVLALAGSTLSAFTVSALYGKHQFSTMKIFEGLIAGIVVSTSIGTLDLHSPGWALAIGWVTGLITQLAGRIMKVKVNRGLDRTTGSFFALPGIISMLVSIYVAADSSLFSGRDTSLLLIAQIAAGLVLGVLIPIFISPTHQQTADDGALFK
eukprot:gnl/Dysnectes_brevis/297_a331_5499.p1 GENE.gnl/Dysnectes_brevis/297_a331_5499~~gnl/Dysnectes_brevis/297_a331_5499.p1  ORF type:complete len:422 (+),score=127.65 gnl/Dysnectes_brevis/297_a331_5499:40-1305(+)